MDNAKDHKAFSLALITIEAFATRFLTVGAPVYEAY